MEKVCRTCLKSADLRPLFPQLDQLQNFERALFLSTGLKITMNDGLPQKICRKCSKTIEKAMKLRSRSQDAEKNLLQYLNQKQNFSDKVKIEDCADHDLFSCKLSSDTNEVNTKSDHSASDIDASKEHDHSHSNLHSPAEQMDELSSDDELLIKKLNSNSKKDSNIDKSSHRNAIRTETYNRKRYLELVEGPLDPKKPIQCKICKKFSKSFNTFEKHAMSHLGYNILCEFCAKQCISTTSLLRHQRAKHGLARDNSFPCSFCGFQAIDKEQLEVHERKIHTKERPFTCDDCGAGFFSKRVLIQHRVNHKADKPFQCNMCPSKFKLRCHLTNHTNRVHNKNLCKYTYGCHICLKRYSSTGDTRKHLVKVHGVPIEQQGKVQRFYIQSQD